MKKVLITIVAVCVMLVSVEPCYAGSEGITASVTTTKAKSSYHYGNGGNSVKIEMYYTEKHLTTGQVFVSVCTKTVHGNYTTATVSKNADTGYRFKSIDVFGYVGNKLKSAITDLKP